MWGDPGIYEGRLMADLRRSYFQAPYVNRPLKGQLIKPYLAMPLIPSLIRVKNYTRKTAIYPRFLVVKAHLMTFTSLAD